MTAKSSAKKPKLSQRARVRREALPSFRVTARDKEVLEAVYAYRTLTTKQLSDLCFVPMAVRKPPLPSSRCLHRLKLLYHYGFLKREELPTLLSEGRKPFVYRLDKAGAALLALLRQSTVEELDWRTDEAMGHLFVDHLIQANDVRVAIARACQRRSIEIMQWWDERTLKHYQKDTITLTSANGKKQNAAIVADGYFHLYTDSHHYHQFLEIDRATVTVSSSLTQRRTWARKVMAYIEYYRSGKYHARYHTKGMRVLTVTTGEKRLLHLREITEESGGKSRFWFTTFHKIQHADILVDPIWQVATRSGVHSLTW